MAHVCVWPRLCVYMYKYVFSPIHGVHAKSPLRCVCLRMSCCHHGEECHSDDDVDIEEMNHFNEIVNSFKTYSQDCCCCTTEYISTNAKFLNAIVENSCGMFGGPVVPPVCTPTAERNISKVRSTLKQFVREWSVEGAIERRICFERILQGLRTWLPLDGSPLFVLCPGSGLGRLPYEICRAGYDCQGNEFSYHMLLGAHYVLNTLQQKCVIYPYILNNSNLRTNHVQSVEIPDVFPSNTSGQMSMCAGEFVEVYEKQGVGIADGIVTCFFIDTAKNILLYIRTIANAVKTGRVWINFGPLLFHYAEQNDQISIELSWEEIRELILEYFDFLEEETNVKCVYSANAESLQQTVYECIYFAAKRNNVLVDGYSNPVF